jgi:hypothetical protein
MQRSVKKHTSTGDVYIFWKICPPTPAGGGKGQHIGQCPLEGEIFQKGKERRGKNVKAKRKISKIKRNIVL